VNYKFTVEFDPENVQANMMHIFKQFGVPNTVIEIGVYEGRTTCWMAEVLTPHNSDLQIHAIDPHDQSIDIHESMEAAHDTFLQNIQHSPCKNINYIRKRSEDALVDLITQSVSAEFIYVDGDHFASTVLTDLVLGYKLLKAGGVMLCDDATEWRFTDKNKETNPQYAPRMAIENFIQCYWHKVKPIYLPCMTQTAFIKLC
jgi:predicted O-methyltransferase YrrM